MEQLGHQVTIGKWYRIISDRPDSTPATWHAPPFGKYITYNDTGRSLCYLFSFGGFTVRTSSGEYRHTLWLDLHDFQEIETEEDRKEFFIWLAKNKIK